MRDPADRIPSCPEGGEVSVHTATPVTPGWVTTCSVHGQLGHGDRRKALGLVCEHAGVERP